MKKIRTMLLVSLAIATPAFAAKPQIQWQESYDFAGVSTFAWKDSPAAVSLQSADPFLHSHIENAIQFQLTNSGLTEVDSNPDVLVTYYGSKDTQTELRSDSYGYGWGTYGGPGWGAYGYGRMGPVSTTTRVVQYETGTLIVDIIDAATNQLIWRGTSADITVSDDADKLKKNITKAIEAMVKQSQKLRAQAGN